MKFLSRLSRLIRIQYIFMRYHLDEILFQIPWFYPLRYLRYLNPWHFLSKNELSRGQRIRLALEALGPIFIKAGQMLSTRYDLLPEDIIDGLSGLQDQVPPFSGEEAKKIIERSLGEKLETIFSEFDLTALASASIAQVHAATLKSNNQSVVIKVLRPNIKTIIAHDLDLLRLFAELTNRYWKTARCFKPNEMVAEISNTLYDELDLLREGASASQLRRDFNGSSQLYIPKMYWEYSRHDVLVMERIDGIPVGQIGELYAAGINVKQLAINGIELFFRQVFRHNFFHADIHPGNIFVSRRHLANPQYIFVDFGIMGSLSEYDQRYLAENMLALFKRDYRRVAELHIDCGWLPGNTRVDQFEGAIRAVCEPIFERPLKDISFGQLVVQLFQTARRFNINIQPQLILLQKTLLNVESMARKLDPELDLWTTATPFLEKWIKKQASIFTIGKRLAKKLERILDKLLL